MIEKKIVGVRNGSKSIKLLIQPANKYQNITLSAETNARPKFNGIIQEILKRNIISEKNNVGYFPGKY
jgi:hypothetical protein